MDTDLALAHELADLADAVALRYFGADGVNVRTKGDGSPVTDADQEVERLLRAEIRRRCPGDAFLGEESGADGGADGGARRRWIIDGIDGTASFVAGEPEWSTLIALQEGDAVALGMVTAPALGRRWWAAQGAGSWTARPGAGPPRRLTLAGGVEARDAAIGIWPPPARLGARQRSVAARLAAHVARVRPTLDWSAAAFATPPPRKPSAGSGTCHGGLLVATGQLDAFLLLGAGPWDLAALVPVVEEAGGTFTDLTGTRHLDTATALFARPGLHGQLLEILTRRE